jgi:hypothetical protein
VRENQAQPLARTKHRRRRARRAALRLRHGVIAGTTQQLTQVFHLSAFELGVTVFMALVGTVMGAMFSGVLETHPGTRVFERKISVT